MGLKLLLSVAWTVISRGFSGRGLADTVEILAERFVDLNNAESEVDKAEIEREIIQLKMISDLQRPSSRKFYSPMMMGQYLIVIPFGIWWAAIHLVSVIKPLILEGRWSVDDLPAHIFDMAWWLTRPNTGKAKRVNWTRHARSQFGRTQRTRN